MCGRGGLDYSWQTVYRYLDIPGEPPSGGMSAYNVAPSSRRGGEIHWTRLPVVLDGDSGREIRTMIWPLIPPWLKGDLPKFSTANCRSEPDQPFSQTVAKKPSFRNAWRRARRCLVPFSWFYEWDQRTQPKQPWRVMPASAPLLILAGLWERSPSARGESRESFTLVTTGPNRLLTKIGHHRAPVVLDADQWSTWLSGDETAAESVIRPPADGALTAEPVTRRVNNPGYQGDDLRPVCRA